MSNKVIASSKIGRAQIFACEFENDNKFITCGENDIKFWTVTGFNVVCKKGNMENFEPLTSAAFAFPSKTCVTGTSTGKLLVWTNGVASTAVPDAHNGLVLTLLAKSNQLISGGEDGIIKIWDSNFKNTGSEDLTGFTKLPPAIRALDMNSAGSFIIGTQHSEIIKIQQSNKVILMQGHYSGQLWGLCVSPKEELFCTCGGDMTIRIWSKEKLEAMNPINDECITCDWSSNAAFIACGSRSGKIFTFSADLELRELSMKQSGLDKNQAITDVKIAPNCQLIAYGALNGASPIEIMKVKENGQDLAILKQINIGLSTPLLHQDWDATSSTLIVNSKGYDLLYVNVAVGSIVRSSSCAENEWYSWTCIFGYFVKALLPELNKQIDISSVCRSQNKKTIAFGKNSGKIKIYRYPCVAKLPSHKAYIGHSSLVSNVKFFSEDRYLISTGNRDNTILIWTSEFDEETIGTKEEEKNPEELKGLSPIIPIKKPMVIKDEEEKEEKKEIQGSILDILDGIKEPSKYLKSPYTQTHPPRKVLKLNYIYGYRSQDTRNNIHYLKDGSIVYHAAAVGIVHDKNTNSQRFFNLHRQTISAIAFHPDGIRVATGDNSEIPYIYIWDSTTCSQIAAFKGELAQGIKYLAFSPTGDYLAAVDIEDDRTLAIYDANNAILVALANIGPANVLQVDFKAENELVSVGEKHIMFWKMNNKSLTSKLGNFAGHSNLLGCLSADKDLVLTGNALGELYQWNDFQILSVNKIHTEPIDCINIAEQMYKIFNSFNRILTGGRDGKVNILDKAFKLLMPIDMTNQLYHSISPGVRTLSLDRMGKKLLVGTAGSEIYELSIDPSRKKVGDNPNTIATCHCAPQDKVIFLYILF